MENMVVGILVSGACGCVAPPGERFMLIAESGRVHLHGRSYEGCATIVLKNTKVFFKVRKILDIHAPNYSDQTWGTKDAITGMSPVCLAVYTCPGVLVSISAAMSSIRACIRFVMLMPCYFNVVLFARLMKTYSTKPPSID